MTTRSKYRLPVWCVVLLLASSAVSGTQGMPATRARTHYADFVRDMDVGMHTMMRDMHAHGYTGDADVDFLAMMIAHHEGAIEMARLVLLHGSDPLVRRLAEEIIATQHVEIRGMRQRYAIIHQGGDGARDDELVLGAIRGRERPEARGYQSTMRGVASR